MKKQTILETIPCNTHLKFRFIGGEISDFIEENNLSLLELGLLMTIRSLDNKHFNLYDLCEKSKTGMESTLNGLLKLEKKNLLGDHIWDKEFVYLVTYDYKYYKIGKTKNLFQRIKTYNTHNPFDVNVLRLISSKNIDKLEKHFLNKFQGKRIKQEWFILNDEDVQYIVNYSGGDL